MTGLDDDARPTPIRGLVFDLGGVVIDLDFGRVFARWGELADADPVELRDRWSMDEVYERHERGEITEAEYFDWLSSALDIELTLDQWVDGWNAIYVGPVMGVDSLLAEVAERYPLYGFTNSNATHTACWKIEFEELLSPFATIFVSSTIGLRKPEARAFNFIADTVGLPIEALHFFDDSEENVVGARAAGLSASHVTTLAELRAATRALA